jgi:hypothetical protein
MTAARPDPTLDRIKVRDAQNTYTATFGYIRASCTAGAEAAVLALGAKLRPGVVCVATLIRDAKTPDPRTTYWRLKFADPQPAAQPAALSDGPEHQALWPRMIAALAEIDAALGLPDDGCNTTSRTLAAIRGLRDLQAKTSQLPAIPTHGMRAAMRDVEIDWVSAAQEGCLSDAELDWMYRSLCAALPAEASAADLGPLDVQAKGRAELPTGYQARDRPGLQPAAPVGGTVRSGIELVLLDLAKWESRVAEDTAALAAAELRTNDARERLAASTRAADSLRRAVSQWEAMQARHETPNV